MISPEYIEKYKHIKPTDLFEYFKSEGDRFAEPSIHHTYADAFDLL